MNTLREHAEELLDETADELDRLTPDDVRALVHELRVHQIELELQNEELRRTQEELRAGRDRYLDLYDFAPVGYLTVQVNGMIREANLTATAMLGRTRTDLLKISIAYLLVDEDQNHYYAMRRQMLTTQTAQGCDVRLQKPSGATFWAHLHGVPALDAEGAVTHFRLSVTDITALKQIEDLRESEQRLRQATIAANAANQIKSEFLAHISHELRTPLNAMLGYAQILQRDHRFSPNQHEHIEGIFHAGMHLLTLLNDILDLAKIEAGKLELEPTSIHLPEFLRQLIAMQLSAAQAKDLDLRAEMAADVPHGIEGDETRLRQVLFNLLSNAIKFTASGSVILRCALVGPAAPLATLGFTVTDTGRGIAADELPHIFDPFWQAHQPHAKGNGTGLGLAISQRLVRKMGGQLEVQSVVGQGSEFRFAVICPVRPAGAPHQRPDLPVIYGYRGPRRQILVVDDNRENRDILKAMLLPLDFDVREAEDGLSAIRLARQERPAALLLDLAMPALDGYETAARIRHIPELRDLIVIAISANVFEPTRSRSLTAGCHDFLPKPVRFEALLAMLQRHLRLEWITAPTDLPAPEIMLPPARAELVRLAEFAEMGDIMALREWVQQHAARDEPPLRPFIARLRGLLRYLDLKGMRLLLRQHLDVPPTSGG